VLYAGQVVEEGPAAEVLASPRHPYTRALLQCVPSFEEGEPPPRGIPGRMPSPTALPDHCRFADRCPQVHERCRMAEPPLAPPVAGRSDEPGHRIRCWLHLEAA
jgi:oligopeptide/dipeptide ABC transporter ATP-binding protein